MAEERKGRKAFTPVHVVHPIPPVFAADSEILILGSFPSVKSREQQFFYGHPQNRFWPLLASILGEAVPETIADKKQILLWHRIAMWDTIYSCDIIGSGDSTIKNAVPTDLAPILAHSQITRIFCNGQTSGKYFRKYQEKTLGITAQILPSTSPANAAWSMDRLREAWRVIAEEAPEQPL